MPVLPNARHERFCQELAKGKTATEAYELAGYSPDRSAASRLSAKINISQRVAELQSRGAEKAVVTVESLIREADEARKLAMELGQPSAAVAAIREKGVLSGKRIERSEQGQPGEFEDMDAGQLREYVAREIAALGVGGEASQVAGPSRGAAGKPH